MTILGVLLGIYLTVAVVVYVVVVNLPGAGGNKLFVALAALAWPIAAIYSLLDG